MPFPNQKARIANPKAGIPNPEARIPNPMAGILNPKAGIAHRKAQILDPKARIPDPKARASETGDKEEDGCEHRDTEEMPSEDFSSLCLCVSVFSQIRDEKVAQSEVSNWLPATRYSLLIARYSLPAASEPERQVDARDPCW
jgi:hypothetical protein